MSHMGIEEEFKEGEAPDTFSAHGRSSDPQVPAEDQFLRRSRRSSLSEENSWGDESLRAGGDPSSEGGAHQGSEMNEPHELLQDHRELQEGENKNGEDAPGLAGPVVAPPVANKEGRKKTTANSSKVLERGTDLANLGIKGLDVMKDDIVDPLSVVGDTANLLDGIGQTFENVQGVTDSLQEGLAPVTEFAQRANAAVGGFAKKVSTIPGTTIKTKDALKFGVGVMNIAQYHRNEGKDTDDVNTFEKGALRDQLLLMRAAGREHAGAKKLLNRVGEAPEAEDEKQDNGDNEYMRAEAEKLRRGAALRRFQATGRSVIANNALVKANKKKKIAPLPALTFEETAALNNKKYVPPKPLGFFDGTKDKPDFVPKKGMLVGKDTWDTTAAPDMANPGEILTGDAALAADPKRQDITRVNAVVNPKANRSALDDSGNVKADPNAVGDQDLDEDEIQARGGDGYRPETEEGRLKQKLVAPLRAMGAVGQVVQGNVDHERLIQQKRYKTAYLARAGELAAKTGTGLAVGATWGAVAGAGPIAAPLMAIGQLPKEAAVHGIQELGRGVQSLSRAGERFVDPEGKAKEQDLKDTWNDFYGHSAPEQQDGEEPQPELADGEDRQVQNVQPAPRGPLSTIEEEPESEQESNEGSELKEESAPGGKISARMDQVLERGVGFGAQRNESELGARGRTWGRAAWDNTAGLGWKLTKALGSGFASVVKAPWHLAKLGAKLVGGAAKYSWKGLKWAGNKIGKGVKKLFGRGGAPAAEVPAQDPAAEEQRRAEESAKYTQRAQGPGAQSGAEQGHLRSLLGGGVDLANTNQRRADVGDDSVQQAYELLQARAAARRGGPAIANPELSEVGSGGGDLNDEEDKESESGAHRVHDPYLFNLGDESGESGESDKDGAGQIAGQSDDNVGGEPESNEEWLKRAIAEDNRNNEQFANFKFDSIDDNVGNNSVRSEQQHIEQPEQNFSQHGDEAFSEGNGDDEELKEFDSDNAEGESTVRSRDSDFAREAELNAPYQRDVRNGYVAPAQPPRPIRMVDRAMYPETHEREESYPRPSENPHGSLEPSGRREYPLGENYVASNEMDQPRTSEQFRLARNRRRMTEQDRRAAMTQEERDLDLRRKSDQEFDLNEMNGLLRPARRTLSAADSAGAQAPGAFDARHRAMSLANALSMQSALQAEIDRKQGQIDRSKGFRLGNLSKSLGGVFKNSGRRRDIRRSQEELERLQQKAAENGMSDLSPQGLEAAVRQGALEHRPPKTGGTRQFDRLKGGAQLRADETGVLNDGRVPLPQIASHARESLNKRARGGGRYGGASLVAGLIDGYIKEQAPRGGVGSNTIAKWGEPIPSAGAVVDEASPEEENADENPSPLQGSESHAQARAEGPGLQPQPVEAGQPRRKFPSDLFNVRDADDEQKQLSQGIASDGIASEQGLLDSGIDDADAKPRPNVPAAGPDLPGEREPRARGSWGNQVDDWNKRADEAGIPLLMDPENPHSFVRDNPFPDPRRSLIEDVPLIDPGFGEQAQAPVHRPAQGPMMLQRGDQGEWELRPEELKEGFNHSQEVPQAKVDPENARQAQARQAPPRRDVGELLDTSAPGLARHRQLMDPREMAILRNAASPRRAARKLPEIKQAVDQAQGAEEKAQATAAWRKVDSLQRGLKKRRLSAGSIPDAGKERARRDELLGGPRMIDASTRHEDLDLPEAEVEDRRLESGGDEQFRLPNFNMPGDTFNINDHADDHVEYIGRIRQNPMAYMTDGYRIVYRNNSKEQQADAVVNTYARDPQRRREIQKLDRRMVEQEYPADVMETKRVLFGDPKKNGKLDSLPTDDASKNQGPMTVDDREVFAEHDHRMPKNPKADDLKFGKYGAHRPFGIWRDRETNQVVDPSHVEGRAGQYAERWRQPLPENQRVKAPAAGWDAMKKPWFWQTQAKQEYREKKESAKNVVADARKKMKDDQMLPPFVEKSAFGKKEWARLEEEERINAELRKAALRARNHGANPTGWI